MWPISHATLVISITWPRSTATIILPQTIETRTDAQTRVAVVLRISDLYPSLVSHVIGERATAHLHEGQSTGASIIRVAECGTRLSCSATQWPSACENLSQAAGASGIQPQNCTVTASCSCCHTCARHQTHSVMQAGTATVPAMLDAATLGHLCCSKLHIGPTHTDSARLVFRVLQAAVQCGLDLQQRYAAGAAQAAQLSQCQVELMPALQVPCNHLSHITLLFFYHDLCHTCLADRAASPGYPLP